MKSRVATLQSIELAGFKSFAKRTKIEFSNGLVAIVGPNGSGKSNITDAIRWVFGEQKTRSLRGDKSEDLIYHGGDGKSRASMAEVIIRLDNSARAIPIELNEIEITRRLYRSGESNYLLNGRRASLNSIQEVLAASGFGVGSYTVIGQGMVDRLILSSGKERKQLFEEASGIKQYEIKHTQTLKRIQSTQENLDQIKILIAELQPKNDMLKRQAELLERRNKLKHDLEQKKSSYIISNSELLDKLILENKNEITKISLELKALDKEIHRIEKENDKTKNSDVKKSLDSVNIALAKLESQKAELEEEIGSTNISVEKLRSDANELDQIIEMSKAEQGSLNENLKEHLKNQKQIEKIVSNFDSKLLKIDNKILVQTKELDKARKELIGSQKSEYLKHSLGLIDILQDGIRREKSEQDLAIVFYKLRRMIKHSMADNSAEIAMKVGKIQNLIARLMDEREKINDSQTNEVIRLRAIEMDSSSIESKIMDLEAKIQQSHKLKSSILSKGNLSKLELKIAKFELQKAELNLSISHKRDELVEIAKQGAQDEIDEYYREHEKLTNQRVALNSQLESLLNAKTDLANQASDIQSTKNLWFPYKMPAPQKTIQISKEEINKLEAEMSLLEEINPEVEKEVQESQKQLNYLSAQANDLKKAVDNLNKVATDTENKIKSVFEKGFDKINTNFTKNFKELFGGGEAELKLSRTNEDHGIEIFVKLPNKNAQNISSLSGGEKALASMALLCGILMSNPSPFVVLDEVDAALDEENTKRFAGIISKITKHSQVLVVTHNHDTMAVADELLGVTTGGNNESSIIKVRLGSVPLEVSK
jgi:chromosome segregation protein